MAREGADTARGRVRSSRRGLLPTLALIALLTSTSLVTAIAVPPARDATATPVTYSSIPIRSWRVDGTGRAALLLGDIVYIGGSFSRATSPDGARSAPRANLAAFDVTTGALITSFRADTNGAVYDLRTDGVSLFVAGTFTTIGGVSRGRVAAIDPATGAVRPGFRADADSTVFQMSRAGSSLYLAGDFTAIGPTRRTRVAKVATATGAVDPSFAPSVDGRVLAVAATPDGSRAYIGGPYGTVNGVRDTDISTLDGRTGATLGPELSGVTGFVDDLEVTPDGAQLIAGHSGVPGIGNRTAVYSTTTGTRRWRQEVDGDVQAVRLVGDRVFAGFHDGADGDGATRVASYDLMTGAPDPTFAPLFDRFMGGWAIAGDSSAIVVAGSFGTVSGVPAEGFAIFPAAPPTPVVARVPGSQPWRYLDDGSDQGTAWRAPGFDDSAWKHGVGEFGYGDDREHTTIARGPVPNAHVTTYFRTTFVAPAVPATAGIYLRVDDGAVVYLNGLEVARDNVPPGPVDHTTLAAGRDGMAETDSNFFPIAPSAFRPGVNTVAVEVHQESTTSDDLSFFPSLVAFGPSTLAPPPPSAPPSGAPLPGVAPPTLTPRPAASLRPAVRLSQATSDLDWTSTGGTAAPTR